MHDPGGGEFILIAAAIIVGIAFVWKLLAAIWHHADRQRKMVGLLEEIRDRLPK